MAGSRHLKEFPPMIRKTLLAIASALVLAACNPVAALDDSEARIARFHDGLARGDGEALYRMTGAEFRATTTRAQFDDLLTVVATRLGTVEASERTNFNVNSNNGTTFTTVVMNTRFAQGEGQETFVFKGTGEDMQLAGWHVTSPRLTLTAAAVADEQAVGAAPPVK